jgi:hypothetical protein
LDDVSMAAAATKLVRLAENLVHTRNEMREAIDKLEHLRKVVDGCANTLIDTIRDALLLAQEYVSEQDGDEVEQPMVDGSSTQGENSVGAAGEHEKRDEVQDQRGGGE